LFLGGLCPGLKLEVKPLHTFLEGILRRYGTVAAAVVAVAMLSSCRRNGTTPAGGQPKGEQKARPVKVATVAQMPLERTITVLGSLAALDQATLSVKVAGRLEHIGVDLGTLVRKGDLIARIEPRDYELRLRQSEALLAQTRARLGLSGQGGDDQVEVEKTSAVKAAKAVLDEATKNRDRVASLVKQGVTPSSELESAQATYEVAANRHDTTIEEVRSLVAQLAQRRAEVDIARQQLADTAIHAPFDGAIQERRANLGEYLAASAPVVTLVRVDPLRLRLEVPERQTLSVRTGLTVRLNLEGDTNIYTGSITRLSPAIIEQNRMLIVEADVPSRGVLRPGLFARAEIVTSTNDPGLVIPAGGLVSFAGLEKVFTVKDGKAVEKLVASGRRGPDWVELVSGAKAGETVVLQPGSLQSGSPVTPGPPAKSGAGGGTE
jgi:RND family efflux transporter MFP subunit